VRRKGLRQPLDIHLGLLPLLLLPLLPLAHRHVCCCWPSSASSRRLLLLLLLFFFFLLLLLLHGIGRRGLLLSLGSSPAHHHHHPFYTATRKRGVTCGEGGREAHIPLVGERVRKGRSAGWAEEVVRVAWTAPMRRFSSPPEPASSGKKTSREDRWRAAIAPPPRPPPRRWWWGEGEQWWAAGLRSASIPTSTSFVFAEHSTHSLNLRTVSPVLHSLTTCSL